MLLLKNGKILNLPIEEQLIQKHKQGKKFKVKMKGGSFTQDDIFSYSITKHKGIAQMKLIIQNHKTKQHLT